VNERNIAAIREHDLETEAAALYSDALPYHNFQHVLVALEAADQIIARCFQEGIRVDPRIVYYALLFHDAGYHRDHRELGHASKEHFSAALASEHLRRHRHGARMIKKVESAILSTLRQGHFVTTEQKTVRAADLSGLAAGYEIFLRNTTCLWDEYEVMTGRRLLWSEWVAGTVDTVQFYLAQEIRLTSFFVNEHGESEFHARARANLQRLQQESAPGPGALDETRPSLLSAAQFEHNRRDT
jgi:predicted metal-dependent HD superfamily phosphohydrolase